MTLSSVSNSTGGALVAPPAQGACVSCRRAWHPLTDPRRFTDYLARRRTKEFTERKDKLGRRYCREDGRPVPCPPEGGKTPKQRQRFQQEHGRPPVREMAARLAEKLKPGELAARVEQLRDQGDPYLAEVADALEARAFDSPEDKAESERLGQKDPSHPVARAIRKDARAAQALEALAESLQSAHMKDFPTRADYERAIKAYHAETVKFTQREWAELPEDGPEWAARRAARDAALAVENKRKRFLPALRKALVRALSAGGPGARFDFDERAVTAGDVLRFWGEEDVFTPSDEERAAVRAELDDLQKIVRMPQGPVKVRLHVLPSGRACSAIGASGEGVLALPSGLWDAPDAGADVWHEMGHVIELLKPGVKDKAAAFLKYRTGDEPEVDMGEALGDPAMAGEGGRKDDFEKTLGRRLAYYAGKTYTWGLGGVTARNVSARLPGLAQAQRLIARLRKRAGRVDATEIISVGMEMLARDPLALVQNDPEYAQFLLGCLLE